jgi:IS4 transposase
VDTTLALLTNDFMLPAQTIAELYRRRWQIELFFKWIKQHLRVRAFFGRTPNAVQVQIWTAICAYLLTAIARKQLKLPQSLHQILQIVSVSAFEQIPLPELVMENDQENCTPELFNQLLLNEI